MAASTSTQQRLARHLNAMGLQTRVLDDERTLLASLPVQGGAFPGLDEEFEVKKILLATIGVDRVKCLRPRALFQLPLVRILGCSDARAIEARIRSAWQSHLSSLGGAAQWLDQLGIEHAAADGGSTRVFEIEGEEPGTCATMIDRNRIVLPSRGPLAGAELAEPDDRIFEIDRGLASSIEFEIALTTHMETLARVAHERAERRDPYLELRMEAPAAAPIAERTRCVLLVGPKLGEDRLLAQKLRRRGFEILTARSDREAFGLFDARTPDLVLCDAELRRSDGTEFVIRLGELTGIENPPVVLVDENLRPARRETARAVGASGYVVRPLEITRLAASLEKMIDAPRRRRFSRFGRQVAVSLDGRNADGVATCLGRRGMSLALRGELPVRSLQRCRLSIPELGRPIQVDAEVLYRTSGIGKGPLAGLRFERFAGSGEAELIRYLKTIDPSIAA